ncbi:MAG: 3-hydroxyacyl-CoA dehydrogenase family protein [Solirubrobacterales bacterium]
MSQPEQRGAAGTPSLERERLGVAGAGTIAVGLAVCSVHERGGHALLWARSEESAQRARESVAELCEKLDHPEAIDRVRVTTALADLRESTFVVEAVREDEQVKHGLLPKIRELLPDDAVLATTTSSLNVEALGQSSGDPTRFVGLHVFNPVTRMDLIEVCFTSENDADVRERVFAFCRAIGKTPVEVPDEPGFVVNRLLFPYLFNAVRLLERTGMEPADLDACMKLGAAYRMGPLELLDLIGLDVAEAIGDAIYADTSDPHHVAPGRMKQLIGEGKLGRKSGAGFYDYR